MTLYDQDATSPEDVVVEPFRLTPGFFGFIGLLLLPAIAVVGVYLGAWIVSDEVYAAEAAASASKSPSASFAASGDDGARVAGWKKTLLGVCPAH